MININTYVGMPYKDKGTDPTGFDCWGLFAHIYKHCLGIEFEEQYPFTPCKDQKKIQNAFDTAIKENSWIRLDKPKEGCAVALGKIKIIHHIGVWTRGGCLHCVKGQGVVYHTPKHLERNGYTKVEFYEWKKPKKKQNKKKRS